MKLLPPFVFIAPHQSDKSMGAGFILETKQPFYLGRIIKLKPSPYSIITYENEFKPLIYTVVGNYSILIAFAGCLERYKVRVSGADWEKELQLIYNQMADFMLNEKINNNLSYYKKYLNT